MNTNPPARAQHIGSLIRPRLLFEKRHAYENGECTFEDVRALEDAAIKSVVKLQKDVGIKVVTDGELRRKMFFDNVFDRLEGMTSVPNRPISDFKSYNPRIKFYQSQGVKEVASYYCTGKIKRTRSWFADEFNYTKSLVAPEEVENIKITMCPPTWYHQRHGSDKTYDPSVYKSDEEYFDDLGIAYRAEIKELYSLGCRKIQIDDPVFCYFCNEDMLEGMEKAGVDHEALLNTYIRAINVCTQDRPHDLKVGIHMCRGNFKGAHFSNGGYDLIGARVFTQVDVDAFYLEYDGERAGGFEPLKYIPLDKTIVLGLVTTKEPKLESAETIKARIEQAAIAMSEGNPKRSREHALNQLCISTQCGFASAWEGNPLTEEDEKNKLDLLVRTAREIWNEE